MPKRNKDDSAPKGSVFSIKTTIRVYHLQADSVIDAQKWVEVICKACGMLPTTDVKCMYYILIYTSRASFSNFFYSYMKNIFIFQSSLVILKVS